MNRALIKWIVIIVIVVIAAVITVAVTNRKNTPAPVSVPEDTEAPIYVRYITSGGMDGSMYSLQFSLHEGKAVVLKETKANLGANIMTEKKKVDAKCADSLKDIFDFYKISEWEAKPSEELILDAATTSITFTFANSKTYTFSDSNKLPDSYYDAFHDVRYCILEYAGMEQK